MDKNIIKVRNIEIKNNRIEYYLQLEGSVKKYFNQSINMFVEYNSSIEGVPEGIAVIPLLTNILPVAWFTDSEIQVETIDKTFYESIDQIKQGYVDMHVNANLKGGFRANNIVDYKYEPHNRCATFFSGGVDSMSTLITRINEKPDLITVWGADISLNNKDAWSKVENEVVRFGEKNSLSNIIIKSSFKQFLNETLLDKSFGKDMGDLWWHGAQHGIGLIGLVVPYAFINKMRIVYVPSTHTDKDGHVSCASYPTIDNKVRFGRCEVLHEGFENSRQDKIKNISRYIKEKDSNLFLRVCWKSTDGKNCSICEKCSRTIMGLIAEGINPNKHGFKIEKKQIKQIERKWKYEWIISHNIPLWIDIQDRFKENKYEVEKEESLKWILDIDLQKEEAKKQKIVNYLRIKIINKLKWEISKLKS